MAIKHIVTHGYGFADGVKFIPTHGYSPAALEAPTGIVDLHLHTRGLALTLAARSPALTLHARSTALTLEDR